ncbi:ABC transporter substrate-binding protein [Thermobrachium celere]|uniref:ABC transporter, periplasmic spermidine putrescine-binding protein PotD (TC 3.A.1.11.1) n=1 Tax=Thermobrachium celere DSM 8682 TaxID=941824 RepID=R7RT35_9CLOT|nr:ABC transporter, periplasmic spermidine putrescine-binding protein PotD (TC 3.A.1.11.1) [Thermobrachium celere DSM 8682]
MKRIKRITSIVTLIVVLFTMALSFTSCSKEEKVTLNVYNWGEYIDESVIKEFEQRYGIKVNYETYATNEEMYTKVKSGGTAYDIVIPSDYMVAKMIREGLLEKLDFSNIPNYKYIDPKFKNRDFDPNNEYTVPYMWGTVGIAYNKKMVTDPVDSWNILWNEKYKGQILMLDSQREAIGLTLKKLGYSLNTTDKNALEKAKQELIKQKPLVLAYAVDEIKDKMIANEAALAVDWAGNAVCMKRQNPDIEFAIPKEGSNLFIDCMVIPKTSKHKKEAEMFINFMCETAIAKKNVEYIGYSTPHTEVYKLLDEKIKNDKTIYPDEETLNRCEIYKDLSDYLSEYDRIWTEVKASN